MQMDNEYLLQSLLTVVVAHVISIFERIEKEILYSPIVIEGDEGELVGTKILERGVQVIVDVSKPAWWVIIKQFVLVIIADEDEAGCGFTDIHKVSSVFQEGIHGV